MMENLPSDHSPLKIQPLGFQNEALYCDGRWEPTKIPHILRATSQFSGSLQAQWGRLSSTSSLRGRPSQNTSSHSSIRHEKVHRRISRTSQEEVIEGTFLPTAGSEEQCVANWLNKITHVLQVFSPTTVSNRVTMHSRTTNPPCFWISETSRQPVQDSLMPWKPDLILQEKLP